MPEADTIESPKSAGFVDRGYNHARKQKQIEEEEKEIARLEAKSRGEEVEEEDEVAEAAPQEETEEDDSNLSREEKSFKKRYGDLRRHMQQKEKDWEEKFGALEKRMEGGTVVPPKSDEDIEAWAKEYPDVAGIVETIAAKKAQEMFHKAESRLSELDKVQYEATRKSAESKILDSHPDFIKLRESDEFHDWAEEQPKWVQDAIYENQDDPASVVRVIDLYKSDKGLTKDAKKASTKKAASLVSKGSRAKVDATDLANQISESEVARMSSKEFEERQDEITKAMRNGKFIYDMSGNAR
mgnify:FL=1|jgi:hypothetical protein|tara:strand:+ start:65 stop:958 length:894 start_codon:yes stop_codon:yes gene_type:complete